MKFAALALAAIATVVAADDKVCDTIGLIQVVGGANGIKCATDSGYSATSGAFPTDAQFNVLCFNDACEAYRNELKAKEPAECIIKGVFSKDTPLYATLITPIEEECKKRRGETSAPPATTTPAPVPSTKPVVTPGPAC